MMMMMMMMMMMYRTKFSKDPYGNGNKRNDKLTMIKKSKVNWNRNRSEQ